MGLHRFQERFQLSDTREITIQQSMESVIDPGRQQEQDPLAPLPEIN